MPYDFVRKQRKYRGPDGEYITRSELRALIDKLTEFIGKEAKSIASRYVAKKITLAQFEMEMKVLLRSGHIISATVGRGGRSLMTQADWGRVGAKIKWQYGYLQKFINKVGKGKITDLVTKTRASNYASSIYVSYARTFKESQTEKLQPGGKVLTDENMLCRLVQNSQEGCEECTADADEGWMPVAEMGEIGSRICGDFCKCEIEFEDEI